MANKTIAELTDATTPLDGTELLHGVQGSNSRKMTVDDIRGLNLKSIADLTLVEGDILYVNGDEEVVRLAKGAALQLLRQNAALTAPEWVTLNPCLLLQDQKSSGTDGGTFTNGAWRTRTLNTVLANEITGASLSSNQVTLPEGTYEVSARAPGYQTGDHRLRIFNITDTDLLVEGLSAFSSSSSAGYTMAELYGRFTLSGAKVIELQHRSTSTQSTNGFGRAASLGTEIYADIRICKLL